MEVETQGRESRLVTSVYGSRVCAVRLDIKTALSWFVLIWFTLLVSPLCIPVCNFYQNFLYGLHLIITTQKCNNFVKTVDDSDEFF
jgi:hypothetical protein